MAFKGLFIGIDRYDSPEINWLSCATRDAKAPHALFTDTLSGETMLLTDEQASVAAIRERLVPRRMNLSGMIPTLTTSQEQRFR